MEREERRTDENGHTKLVDRKREEVEEGERKRSGGTAGEGERESNGKEQRENRR